MQNVYKILENTDFPNVIAKIVYDTNSESPDAWGDEAVFLTANDRRHLWVRPKVADNLFPCEGMASKLRQQFHVFPVEAYIHSGITLSLWDGGKLKDQWDSKVIGFVCVKRTECASKVGAHKMAQSCIDTWNQYLGGEVYGYVVETLDGEHLESCYGFYGDPSQSDCENQAIEAAKCEDARIQKEEDAFAEKQERANQIVESLKEGNVLEDEEAELLSEFIHRP